MCPSAIKTPLDNNDLSQVVEDKWDAEFIQALDEDRLLDVMLAANYLHIESLFSLCCA
jgi:hypothetical protein